MSLGLLRFYKSVISPYWPLGCRYYPTCSEYCYETVEKLGIAKGIWLTMKRLARCHPFAGKGYDPAP